jgi:hypothetical protein
MGQIYLISYIWGAQKDPQLGSGNDKLPLMAGWGSSLEHFRIWGLPELDFLPTPILNIN